MKSGTLRVKCSCKHDFQDSKYGKNVRVATPVNKKRSAGKLTQVYCTVCGNIHYEFTER